MRKNHLYCWIKSLLLANLKPELFIIEEKCDDLDYWEIFYISYFKSIGCNLTNYAKGGESRGGFQHTEEHKNKMSVLFKGRPPWNKGLKLTTEQLKNKVYGNRDSWKNTPTSSKYTGVSFHKTKNKWASYIFFKGKLLHLGFFSKEEDAYKARINKENELLIN
jgi:hypothetical protein